MPNIRAEIRVRPSRNGILRTTETSITAGTKKYEFDAVHVKTTQEELYVRSVHPLVQLFLEGHNCSVIAYGQTGSGKTYTIGISPRCRDAMVQRTLAALFESGQSPTCTFIEIYNEEVFDLLTPERIPLNLRAASNSSSACIVGITEMQLDSLEMALRVLKVGCENRTTKSTRMNAESSRSHAVYTLRLACSSFSFVDLAGSERLKRTQCRGETVRESISINTGLLALGNVISALYSGKRHIPFRDSKITRILEPCLASRLLFVACVSPLQADLSETANTLKYAGRAAKIAVEERTSVVEDQGRAEIVRLEREVSRLREENNRLRSQLRRAGLAEELRAEQVFERTSEREVTRQTSAREVMKQTGDRTTECITRAEIERNEIQQGKANTADVTMNRAVGKSTRRRIVSFNLDPRNGRGVFTPRRDAVRLFPCLVSSLKLTCSAMAVAENKSLLAALPDGSFVSVQERVEQLFVDQPASSLVSGPFGLFYSSGSLLKAYGGGERAVLVRACDSPITALSASGNVLYIGHADGSLTLFDMVANAQLFSERLHDSAIFGIVRIGTLVFTGSRDHSVRFHDAGALLSGARPVRESALSPPHYDAVSGLLDYGGMLVSFGRDCAVKTWKGTDPYKTVAGAHPNWIKGGGVADNCWVTGCRAGELRCWDLQDGSVRCVGKTEVGQPIESVVSAGSDVWVGGRRELRHYKLS